MELLRFELIDVGSFDIEAVGYLRVVWQRRNFVLYILDLVHGTNTIGLVFQAALQGTDFALNISLPSEAVDPRLCLLSKLSSDLPWRTNDAVGFIREAVGGAQEGVGFLKGKGFEGVEFGWKVKGVDG